VAGFEVQHGHFAGPAGDEVYEHEVTVFVARHFHHTHARGHPQLLFRAIIVLRHDRRGRYAQYPFRLFRAHLRAQVLAPVREPDVVHVASSGHYPRFAQVHGVGVVEFFAWRQRRNRPVTVTTVTKPDFYYGRP